MLALKIIYEEEVTGYDLIKRIERISGRKPSSGTIYPMLKSMTEDGWIERREDGKRALYSITETGREKMAEFRALRNEYLGKIMEAMSIAGEAFNTELRHSTVELLLPFFIDVKELIEKGVPSEEIAEVVADARKKLKKIEEMRE